MSDRLPGLIVLAIGGSIAPPLLLLTILFLGSQRPLPNATALALGYFATCAAMGILGLTLFGGAGSTASAVGRVISAMVGGLLIVLGLRSLLYAPDPDASLPGWMESINAMSPARAFGFGMALFPLQIKNLAIFVACLNLIAAASLNPQGNVAALGLVLVIFAIPVLALIGLYAAVPQRASAVLGSFGRGWRGTTARSRLCSASCSGRSSSSEASRNRKTLCNYRRTGLGALTIPILTTMVGVAATLLTICLPPLSCVCGKKAKRETSLLGLHSPCFSHIPGAHNG